jgi:protein TonB
MRQAAEFTVFLMLATVSHLVLFQRDTAGVAPSAGSAGGDMITLAASTEDVSAMVAEWDRPVETLQQIDTPSPVAPVAPQEPSLSQPVRPEQPERPIMPMAATAQPDFERLPTIDTAAPPSPLAVTASVRPKLRPAPRKQTLTAPANQSESAKRQPTKSQTAKGSGQRKASGNDGSAKTTAKRQAASPALMAQWGNSIRAAVERRKRYPAGTRSRGTAVLSIGVSTAGALSSVQLRKSSGEAKLDQAALTAVRRARFKPAPGGLPAGVHHFSLPIAFNP